MLRPCAACSREISSEARACPQCGHPQQPAIPFGKTEPAARMPGWVIFLLVLVAVVAFVKYAGNQDDADAKPIAETVEAARPPLDFNKQIYTSDHAIICPQSIFYDYRADRGFEEVSNLFTAIFSRAEKEKALGCVEWKAGIPVKAHQMAAPLDSYVSIDDAYFTIKPHLQN